VYAIHESVGHLGIFVSGTVARKEHDEFASNVDLIDVLPPGLWEAVITRKTAESIHPELVTGEWIVRFERRTLDDVRAIVRPDPENERRFATVRRVSEINLGLYRSFLQPFVRALAGPQTAAWLRLLNPAALPFELFSDRNPHSRHIAQLAGQVRRERRPASPDNPFLHLQANLSDGIMAALDGWRDVRDRTLEQIFLATYSNPLLQALVGLRAADERPRRQPGVEPERIAFVQEQIRQIKARIAEGGPREAEIRSGVFIGMAGPDVDERVFGQLRRLRAEHEDVTLKDFKRMVREQFFALLLDADGALAALPTMLSADDGARSKALEEIRAVVSAAGNLAGERAKRLARIEAILGAPAPAPRIGHTKSVAIQRRGESDSRSPSPHPGIVLQE
jgi:hypothetical protein